MIKTDRARCQFGVFALTMLCFLTAPNCIRNVAAQDLDMRQTTLDVRFQNSTEIFTSQTLVTLEVQPKNLLGPESPLNEKGLCLNIVVSKKKQSDETPKIPITELEIQIPALSGSPWFPASFLAPTDEGIYEITVSLQRKEERSINNRPLLNFANNPLQRRSPKIVAETVVSCVVLNQNLTQRLVGSLDSMKKEILEASETVNPTLRKHLPYIPSLPKVAHLTSPKMPELPKLTGFLDRSQKNMVTGGDSALIIKPIELVAPLDELNEQWKSGIPGRFGSGNLKPSPTILSSQLIQHQALSVLSAATEPNTVSWEAIPLPIREINKPYLVELDYPAEIPQSLGIGIVELLNYGGKTFPALTKDSGIHVIEEVVSDQILGRIKTHRLLFWPKTKQPMLLLVNRDRHRNAQFSDFRLYQIEKSNTNLLQAGQHIEIPKPFDGQPQRLVAGYIHRADFLDDLSSSTELRATGIPSRITDWQISYDSSKRMIAALRQSGYDGAMVNVASNETMLYPSNKFGDDYYKDSLELLACLFDREQLTLIPAIDFNFPIPELENLIQTNPILAEELLWSPSGQATGPRYNLLHPTVQNTLFGILRELIERYSRHPSFGGVAVLLTPDGSARLPLIHRELDDQTFSQFLHDIQPDIQKDGLVIPSNLTATDPETWQQRKIDRAQFIQSDAKAWNVWFRWRIKKIQNFYSEVTKIITEKRPDAKLFLAAGTLLDSPEIRSYCQPSLSRLSSPIPTPVYALQMLGYDPALLVEIPSLVFLRPHRVSNIPDSMEAASYTEFDAAEAVKHFSKGNSIPGVLFYHDSQRVPAEYHNRRRFVKQLAQSDVGMFIDGGKMFPSGEESAVYDLLATFRQLPAVPFQTFLQSEKPLQPITVRYANTAKGLIVYLVNDAPFGVSADLSFSAVPDCQLTELSGRRTIDPMIVHNGSPSWKMTLQPFDLAAVVLSDPQAAILNVDVNRPLAICGENGKLRQKVDQLRRLTQAVNSGILWNKLGNPDFETVSNASDEISGWKRLGSPTFTTQLDSKIKNSGQRSLKLSETISEKTENQIIISEPFEAPMTRQLAVSVFIGISDSALNNVTENMESLPLDIILSARQQNGEPLFLSYRVEPALLPLFAQAPSNNGVRWHRLNVPFNQLPTGLEDFRVGFRLYAPGTVWIDNVTLYQMTLTSNEIKALQWLVLLANSRCSADQVSDLLTILDGYWSQYLFRHIPLPLVSASTPLTVAAKESGSYPSQVPPSPLPKKEEKSLYNRVKDWFSK